MSVSSSQGFTSRRMDDFAIRVGFVDFLAAYAFTRSALIRSASASSSSSDPKRSTSSSSAAAAFAGAAVVVEPPLTCGTADPVHPARS